MCVHCASIARNRRTGFLARSESLVLVRARYGKTYAPEYCLVSAPPPRLAAQSHPKQRHRGVVLLAFVGKLLILMCLPRQCPPPSRGVEQTVSFRDTTRPCFQRYVF